MKEDDIVFTQASVIRGIFLHVEKQSEALTSSPDNIDQYSNTTRAFAEDGVAMCVCVNQ
jgi:hypothetical protein